jgi:hypothetical protein
VSPRKLGLLHQGEGGKVGTGLIPARKEAFLGVSSPGSWSDPVRGRDASQGIITTLLYRRGLAMRQLRTAIAAAILVALTIAATQSTVANGPPQPVEPQEFELPAGQACDFGLRVSQSGGNLHIKEFVDRNDDPVKSSRPARASS